MNPETTSILPAFREKKHPTASMAIKKSTTALLAVLVLAVPAGASTLKVSKERSRIQVDARATGHQFTGTLDDYDARVRGNPSTLAPEAFELKWTFDHLKTGEHDRDVEMIKWLGGGAPAGSFTFTKAWKDKSGRDFAMGEIRIHGVRKEISFPFTVKKEGRWVTIDGTARLNYKDFSLPTIRSMAVMTVKPELSVRFHIVGTL